jgi:hypothetical protein
MTNRIYHAFKQSLDGRHDKWGYVPDLGLADVNDSRRFPMGRQIDDDGRAFVWGYALMPRYCFSEERALRVLGRAIVPSAAGSILQKLAR